VSALALSFMFNIVLAFLFVFTCCWANKRDDDDDDEKVGVECVNWKLSTGCCTSAKLIIVTCCRNY